jgi:vacuolar-type H+-ATPase subunit H
MERVPGTTPVESGSSTQVDQVTEQAKQQSQQLAHQARQQASNLASRTSEQAKSQLANHKHNASQSMVPIQSALRESAQQLRNQGQGQVGDYAEKAADQVERFSTYLRQTEVDEIMEEVRGFARRRPGLFVGSAAAVGFFATRFLKSTSEEAPSEEVSSEEVSSEEAPSAGYGDFSAPTTPTATSTSVVTHGTKEPPATALPPVGVEVEPPPAGERSGQPPNAAEGELDRETDLRRRPRDSEVE